LIAALVLARTVCPVLRSRKQIVLTRVDGGLRAELHGDLATIASFAQKREGVSKNAGPAGFRRYWRWLRGPTTNETHTP
jgi:hypothetical protein